MSDGPSYVITGADAVTLVPMADQGRWLLMYVVAGAGDPRYLDDGDLAETARGDQEAVIGQVETALTQHYALTRIDPTGEEAAAWILRPREGTG